MSDAEAVRALARQARSERHNGRMAEAVALQHGAVAMAERVGDPALLAHTLRHLADMLSDMGEALAALPWYDRALALYRDGDADPLDIANAVRGAALNFERMGAGEEARRYWADARARYAAIDARMRAATGGGNPGVEEADAHLAAL
ncbi:MAG: tetratricopeptide repeat protein [Pseudomonadota bacterium]